MFPRCALAARADRVLMLALAERKGGADRVRRRAVTFGLAASAAAIATGWRPAVAAGPVEGRDVMRTWYRLVLELVRHTPTYSPPVASRAFACLGITAFEAVAGGDARLLSLAGQLPDLTPLPPREAAPHDEALVLHAALGAGVRHFFANTGPTGQRAMAAMQRHFDERLAGGLSPEVAQCSIEAGERVAAHVIAWSATDGGAVVENMGFAASAVPPSRPEQWVPTSLIAQQQAPLLPTWGQNRPFAMPSAAACGLPPPPAYSEMPGSAFHAEAMEVVKTVAALTDKQRRIARFWADDPMLSPTPPGHWVSIAAQVLATQDAPLDRMAEVQARLGIALADAFIACWATKFEYDLLRPVTYIRRVIDPAWEPLLNTPPFPEYPSGHSTQSGAAAAVLTAMFGEDFAFEDATHVDDGLPARSFPSFAAAAEEAGLSRLYGGIHFRAAIERGLEQGVCVGAHATALRMRA